MKPVYQTIISSEDGTIHGNCFPACIASLLEIGIEEVPKFQDMGNDWFKPFWKFLSEKGYEYVGTTFNEEELNELEGVDGYFIVGGTSPRPYVTRGHAVIYKYGQICFDPYPSNEGIIKFENAYIIQPKKDVWHVIDKRKK